MMGVEKLMVLMVNFRGENEVGVMGFGEIGEEEMEFEKEGSGKREVRRLGGRQRGLGAIAARRRWWR